MEVRLLATCTVNNLLSQSTPSEPGLVDAGVELVNAFVSRMLASLPDLTWVDLSTVKGKGQ